METQQAENKKQEEELRMLREQRDLLRKLVEQQRQVNNTPCVDTCVYAYNHQLIKVTPLVVCV